MLDMQAYFLSLFHGLSSSIIGLLGLYLLGITAFPRVIFEKTNITCVPFFCGAGLFSLVSWYGIQGNIPLIFIFKALLILLCVAILLRLNQRSFRSFFSAVLGKATWIGLGAFIFFYILIAFVISYPIDSQHLPLSSFGNNDIFSYINNARHLFYLNESNIEGLTSYITSGNYYETPADFYFLDLLSVFYHDDIMRAAMPLIYGCMALIGLMIMRYCRLVFSLPIVMAIAIAAVMITCPFYRYIGTQYFLSTLIATLALLGLLTDTACYPFFKTKKAVRLSRLLYLNLPYYILLYFAYSVIFFTGILVQWGFMMLMLSIGFIQKHDEWKSICHKALLLSTGLLLSVLIVFLLDPWHTQKLLKLLIGYSQVGQHGWPLHWIGPFSRLGIYGHMEIHTPTLMILWASVFAIFIMGLIYWVIKSHKQMTSSELALFFLAIIAFFVYDLYFYLSDAAHQYQPWKFASYYNLPLAGAIWAMVIKRIEIIDFGSEKKKRLRLNIIIGVLLFLIGGNVFYAMRHRSDVQLFSAKYHDLALLEHIDAPVIWVKMATYSSTFLAPYFIQNKKLYLLSNSYYTPMILDPTKISRQWPLFVEQSTSYCEKIAPENGMKIGEVGCLYFTEDYSQY